MCVCVCGCVCGCVCIQLWSSTVRDMKDTKQPIGKALGASAALERLDVCVCVCV